MKIISNYKKENTEKLNSGDVVFMKACERCNDFYGIYVQGVGIIELENGSDAYCRTQRSLSVGDTVSYWTVDKIFDNCELVIHENNN